MPGADQEAVVAIACPLTGPNALAMMTLTLQISGLRQQASTRLVEHPAGGFVKSPSHS